MKNRNSKNNDFKNKFVIYGIDEKNKNLYKSAEDKKKMDDIINLIESNPQILNNLSYSKLEKIDELYDKKIEEIKAQIIQLRKTNN